MYKYTKLVREENLDFLNKYVYNNKYLNKDVVLNILSMKMSFIILLIIISCMVFYN